MQVRIQGHVPSYKQKKKEKTRRQQRESEKPSKRKFNQTADVFLSRKKGGARICTPVEFKRKGRRGGKVGTE